MRLFGFLNLRGIGGQIAALVVASMVGLQLVITATFLFHRPDRLEFGGEDGAAQLASAAQLLGSTPAAERPRLMADIVHAFPLLDIRNLAADAVPASPAAMEDRPPQSHHLRRLGRGYRVFPLAPPGGPNRKVGVMLPDGSAISAFVA